jgi:nucleoid-associated protein YgaU
MARYTSIPVITTQDNPKRRFINVKYPDIPRDFSDTYVYTTQGDRYDLLAQTYYGNSSLWWVISRANPSQPSDSIYPGIWAQIRIPSASRIPTILGTFENLNRI